ncbi:MAG: HD domain-containing protein [Candidatus Rokuibacteriota bacterium]
MRPIDATLTSRFDEAFLYAAIVHAGQKRKGTEIPYIAHLLSVAGLVLEDGGDEEEAIAALLHDAVEDGGGRARLEDIRARFGERVAAIVEGCSDSDTVPKPPWRERKERHLKHLRDASPSVLRVSAADKLHNARAILADYRAQGESLWKRFNAGRDDILWYYRCLVGIFRERGPASLTEELDQAVSEIEALAGFRPALQIESGGGKGAAELPQARGLRQRPMAGARPQRRKSKRRRC